MLQILNKDCRVALRRFKENHFTACVTDPPYELGFMGKAWDKSGIAFDPATWAAVYRVLAPGGFLLAFGGTRTFHRIVIAIEDAGFEIRDCLSWLHGQGFPKSLDISKAIDNQAGATRRVIGNHPSPAKNKPGGNSLKMSEVGMPSSTLITAPATPEAQTWNGWGTALKPAWEPIIVAMKPLAGTFAHNALTHSVAGLAIDKSRIGTDENLIRPLIQRFDNNVCGNWLGAETKTQPPGRFPANVLLDEEAAAQLDAQAGPVARFFYTAKASKKERGEGNNHPTVKPLALMRYLINLVTYPERNLILDPFLGSGTTLLACKELGLNAVGIDNNPEYVSIAKARIFGFPQKTA